MGLDAPFLELAYYVGLRGTQRAMATISNRDPVDVGPARLSLPNLIGISSSPEELEVMGSVVVVRTEGEAFCGPMRKQRGRLRSFGKKAYDRFVDIADSIECEYAAILVEYSLEGPDELRRDPRSLAFRNFFVSRELGQSALDEIIHASGEDAYVEELKSGVYVSMSAEFNPAGQSVDPLDAEERSMKVAKIVGRLCR